jgi:hypothetical protein
MTDDRRIVARQTTGYMLDFYLTALEEQQFLPLGGDEGTIDSACCSARELARRAEARQPRRHRDGSGHVQKG